MKKEIEIPFYPEHAFTSRDFLSDISKFTGINQKRITGYQIIKRSIDGRSQSVKVRIRFEITIDEPFQKIKERIFDFQDVHNKAAVNIVGAGPAGLFAALQLIEKGLKPIIIERGKPCSERKIDIALLYKEKKINAESNYCFGAGGAGTFSDGKLYTRSSKRGDVNRILQLLVNHGANPDILIDAHPHIGSDKLPAIITNICKTITDAGGEIYFNEKVIDIEIKDDTVKSVKTSSGKVF